MGSLFEGLGVSRELLKVGGEGLLREGYKRN
jgi:hypothetical protein